MYPKQAVILAGGLGTRLLPFTKDNPKPMIDINGKPFLSHIFEYLKANGIKKVLLLIGYKSQKIIDYYANGSALGINIEYSVGDVDWKTGRRLKKAQNKLDDKFLLLYCDNYCPIDLKDIFDFHLQSKKEATVAVYSNNDLSTKNNMCVSKDNMVIAYDKSRTSKDLNGVDIGFFILSKNLIEKLPNSNFPFEKVVIPDLIQRNELGAYRTNHKYYSIGSVERLPQTKFFLSHRKVIFLDRDGVINEKAPKAEYINEWSQFKFIKGSISAIKKLAKNNFEIYVITNQAGISRGKTTLESLEEIHNNLVSKLLESKIKINGIYFCPHGWNDGCTCRKPRPGMLFQASYDHYINLKESILIGDDPRDILAGEAADIKECFLVTPEKPLSKVVDDFLK